MGLVASRCPKAFVWRTFLLEKPSLWSCRVVRGKQKLREEDLILALFVPVNVLAIRGLDAL